MILWKKNVLKVIVWNFVWEGVRCDASNRLLRNTSRDLHGVIVLRLVWYPMVRSNDLPWIHVVSTGSHPKIPPRWRKAKSKQDESRRYKIKYYPSLSHGSVQSARRPEDLRSSRWTPTPQEYPPFFPDFFLIFRDFSGISGVSLLNQRIFRDFWGPGGGGVNFPVFFQNLPWICAYGAWL